MENKYQLREHTSEYEIVNSEDFISAYIQVSFLQDYNWTSIKEHDDYFTISSPSPKTNYCGYHKTLVLEKCLLDESGNDTLIELVDIAITRALELGKELGSKKTMDEVIYKLNHIGNEDDK